MQSSGSQPNVLRGPGSLPSVRGSHFSEIFDDDPGAQGNVWSPTAQSRRPGRPQSTVVSPTKLPPSLSFPSINKSAESLDHSQRISESITPSSTTTSLTVRSPNNTPRHNSSMRNHRPSASFSSIHSSGTLTRGNSDRRRLLESDMGCSLTSGGGLSHGQGPAFASSRSIASLSRLSSTRKRRPVENVNPLDVRRVSSIFSYFNTSNSHTRPVVVYSLPKKDVPIEAERTHPTTGQTVGSCEKHTLVLRYQLINRRLT
jgi:hypothetical protein